MQYLRLSYVVYLVFIVLSTFILLPLQAAWVLAFIKLIPLLAFLPAIWHKHSYGLLTLTLVVLLYMGFAVMDCFASGLKQGLAFAELMIATWLILACSKAVKSQPRGHGA